MGMALTLLKYSFFTRRWFQIVSAPVQRIRKLCDRNLQSRIKIPFLFICTLTALVYPMHKQSRSNWLQRLLLLWNQIAIPISERRWEYISSVTKTLGPCHQVSNAMSRLLHHSSGLPKELDGAGVPNEVVVFIFPGLQYCCAKRRRWSEHRVPVVMFCERARPVSLEMKTDSVQL